MLSSFLFLAAVWLAAALAGNKFRPFWAGVVFAVICTITGARAEEVIPTLRTQFKQGDPSAATAPENVESEYVQSLRARSEQGDADAQYKLGLSYSTGLLVPFDSAESLKWYRRAAAQGHVKAQEALDKINEETQEFFLQAFDDAAKFRVDISRKRAEQGDVVGQFNLGKWYYFGEGVPQDYAEAAEWIGLAAEQGLARAQFRFGIMYHNGEGVSQNYREAFIWHFLAAENGLSMAAKHRDGSAKLLSPADLANAKTEAIRRHAEIGNYADRSFLHNPASQAKLTVAPPINAPTERENVGNDLQISQRCPSDIEERDKSGATPLHQAAKENDHRRAILLIDCGANTSALDSILWTPLHWAASRNATTIITALLEQGVDIEAKSDARDVYLGPGASAPAVLEGARTPLHIAAGNGNVEAVIMLLDRGANIEARDALGYTPLHRAVGGVRLDVGGQIYVYLTGEEPNSPPKGKMSAIIAELIDRGANVKAVSDTGKTPMQLAAFLNKYEIIDQLQKAAQQTREIPQEPPKSIFPAAKTEAGGVFETTWRSVVVVEAGNSQGSGVALKPNLVATNCHVTDAATSPIAIYKGENRRADKSKSYPARVIAGDRKRDVCLLAAEELWAIPAEARNAAEMRIAEQVYAVGAPRGLDFSISGGLVSQLREEDEEGRKLSGNAPLIQTDTAISPGSSGGGLFDAKGKLVGLTTFGYRDSEGLNFAVPIEWALELIPDAEQ